MLIKSLSVKKLCGQYDYDLTFNPDFNIFTGRNGAGKTMLMKLMYFHLNGDEDSIGSEIAHEKYSIDEDRSNETHSAYEEFIFDYDTKKQGHLFFPTFRKIEGGFNNYFERVWHQIKSYSDYYDNDGLVFCVSMHDVSRLLHAQYNHAHHDIDPKKISEIEQTLRIRKNEISDEELQKEIENISKANEIARPQTFRRLDILAEVLSQFMGKKERLSYDEMLAAIDSGKLSSGEMQMLSILIYCAFRENSVIFIDEPELSLHIDWQRLFIPTLERLQTSNQYFMSTHSPFIYARYPQKEIILDQDKGGK